MSQASEALLEGFRVRRDVNGEPLTFNAAAAVVGTVNRAPDRKPDGKTIDFNARDASVIETEFAPLNVAKNDLVGKSFEDEFGYFHRVQSFKLVLPLVYCNCTVSS